MVVLVCACATVPSAPSPADTAPSDALTTFITLVDAGHFEDAYQLLSAPLRARYTPDLLKRDWDLEPLAKERLDQARQALARGCQRSGEEAVFSLGGGRAVRLVREAGAFKVAALE